MRLYWSKLENFIKYMEKMLISFHTCLDINLKKVENAIMCGFPLSSIHKVMAKLETNKINYLIVDRRNTYEVEEISDNKNLNQYIKYFKKAKKYVNYKIRIEYINHFMLENMEKEYMKDFINKIEKMIDERRKVSSN